MLFCCLGSACADTDVEQAKGDVDFGAYLSSTCAGCHSKPSAKSGIPSLEALSPDTILAALNDYKSGVRDNATMRTIASSLSDGDLDALIAYYVQKQKSYAKTKKQ